MWLFSVVGMLSLILKRPIHMVSLPALMGWKPVSLP